MDERQRFVARLLEGEKMTELCREFDISRKTRSDLETALAKIAPVSGAAHARAAD
jgi:hypothetical protein